MGFDWYFTYRTASMAFLHGLNPYPHSFYFAAPWLLPFLIPFSLLHPPWDFYALSFVGFLTFALIAYKISGKSLFMICLFLLSAPVTLCLWNGNIEWLCMLGFLLPAGWGLPLLLIKPQIGIGVAVFYGFQVLLRKRSPLVFLPSLVLLLWSIAFYDLWFMRWNITVNWSASVGKMGWNLSLWPYGLIIGIPMILRAIISRKREWAIASSPFLSPYGLLFNYASVLMGSMNMPLEFIGVWIGLWIATLLRVWG